MTDRPAELFLWLDLETTGLDPDVDEIVEVGAILTDADLRELADESLYVVPSLAGVFRLVGDDTVREMHTDSGLLAALMEAAKRDSDAKLDGDSLVYTTEWVEGLLIDMIDDESNGERIILAGNNVDAFDRRFLERHMPTLAGRLHYHGHDVGAHLTTYRHAGDPLEWAPVRAHRALDDARAALEVERQVRARLARRAGLAALVEQADELSAHFEREAWAEPAEPSYIYRDGRTVNQWSSMLADAFLTGGTNALRHTYADLLGTGWEERLRAVLDAATNPGATP